MASLRPIDMAYAEINAIGGVIDRNDPVQVARDTLLGEVLAILAGYGAVDAREISSLQQFEAEFYAHRHGRLEVAA